jgi:hypothetical protein
MTGPPHDDDDQTKARTSVFLLGLIIAAACVVVLQYTPYRLFSAEKTSTLWGVLVGLIMGGFIFGWLRMSTRD